MSSNYAPLPIKIVDLTEYSEEVIEESLIPNKNSVEDDQSARFEEIIEKLKREKSELAAEVKSLAKTNARLEKTAESVSKQLFTALEANRALQNAPAPKEDTNKETDTLRSNILEMEKDFKNLSKRTQTSIDNAESAAIEKVMKSMFTFFDAVDAAKKMGDIKKGTGIYKMITQLENMLLTQYGVSKVNQTNIPFDTNVHHCVSLKDTKEGVEEGTVLTILQTGYNIGEKNIRPALVAISS